jgi:SAM-dependent methyltransferase
MSDTAYEITACPVCGSRDERQIAGPDEVKREVEWLWEFHTRRLQPDTPPERLVDRVAFSQAPPLRVVQCAVCGLVYRNPRERAWTLRDSYATEAPAREAMDALFQTQLATYRAQAERLTDVAGRVGIGLEVGSYVGGFLEASRERGWSFEGLDVNEEVNAVTRERGFRVTTGDLESFRPTHAYAAVAIWNCLDQLPDPAAAVIRARALLEPGGTLALRVPNGDFYARVRPHIEGPMGGVPRALLAHNNLLGFPYRQGFTPSSLERLVERTGLRVVHVHNDTLVPIADEFTRRWAALEERALKQLLHAAKAAPWFEMYAVERD